MGYTSLILGSVTRAQRARNLLIAQGIYSTVVRGVRNNCTYGVRVEQSRAEEAIGVLEAAGMRVMQR